MINLFNYRIIIFDLDDTIYNELLYLKQAYRYIGECLCQAVSDCESTPDEISSFLFLEFEKEGRSKLYEKLSNKYNIGNFCLDDFLKCMRTVPLRQGSLKINSDMYNLIDKLIKKEKMVFILTNGNIDQQKNKINSLDFPHKDKIKVYYASSMGFNLQKPNPYFVNKIKISCSSIESDIIFIGDSEVDKKTAFNSDIDFINVQDLESQSKY